MARFRKYVYHHGTKRGKLDIVEHFVYGKFEQARAGALPVHDNDIRRWALEKAKEESLEDFTASHHWLINFKKCHQITSRRITKFVTKHEIEDTAEIQKSAHDFVFQAREEMKKFKPNEILKTPINLKSNWKCIRIGLFHLKENMLHCQE
jgi:hypothetical protein